VLDRQERRVGHQCSAMKRSAWGIHGRRRREMHRAFRGPTGPWMPQALRFIAEH